MRTKQTLIAEVKTHSPFGFHSEYSWDHLFALAEEIGDILSIHTDNLWGGSFDLLKKARKLTQKPILAKGIHAIDEDIDRAIALGADYVLVVGRIPKAHLEQCLIEPVNLNHLKTIRSDLKVVWNSRNLETGASKTETFSEARANFLGWLCQASNISRSSDISAGADAVLIGQNLPKIYDEIKSSTWNR